MARKRLPARRPAREAILRIPDYGDYNRSNARFPDRYWFGFEGVLAGKRP